MNILHKELPITAEFSSFFGKSNLTKKFISFDSEMKEKIR